MTRPNRFAAVTAAALLGFGFATAAVAHDGPYVVGSGENASVVYPEPSTNIVGGALSRSTGSGESEGTQVLAAPTMQPAGRIGRLVGSGENQSVVYDGAAPSSALGGLRG